MNIWIAIGVAFVFFVLYALIKLVTINDRVDEDDDELNDLW